MTRPAIAADLLMAERLERERARIRKRLLDTVRRITFMASDGSPGGAKAYVVLRSELLAALDRICPVPKED